MSINAHDTATIVGAAGVDAEGVRLYLYSKSGSPFPADWYRVADGVDKTHALMAASAAVQTNHTANVGMVDGKVSLIVCNAS